MTLQILIFITNLRHCVLNQTLSYTIIAKVFIMTGLDIITTVTTVQGHCANMIITSPSLPRIPQHPFHHFHFCQHLKLELYHEASSDPGQKSESAKSITIINNLNKKLQVYHESSPDPGQKPESANSAQNLPAHINPHHRSLKNLSHTSNFSYMSKVYLTLNPKSGSETCDQDSAT